MSNRTNPMRRLLAVVFAAGLFSVSLASSPLGATSFSNEVAANSTELAQNPCNPCNKKKRAQNPCNPCGKKAQNPCNPCSGKKMGPAHFTGKVRTFTGNISDSSCGLRHTMMPGKSDKECTLACVKMGSKYVLADETHKVVYQLDDQKAPAQYAGQNVKITGRLDPKTKTIQVKSIHALAANPCNPCGKKRR